MILIVGLYVVVVLEYSNVFGAEDVIHAWEINLQQQSATRFGDVLVVPRNFRKYGTSNTEWSKEKLNPLWQNNTIPYSLSSRYTPEERSVITQALFDLQLKSCFKFNKRTTESDYLDVRPLDGCYSFVGRIGGAQLVSLAPGCIVKYVIMHEIMHAIGFEHEHQRPDRDEYIRVIYTNVQPEQISNFEKLSPSEIRTFGISYDYMSIMHYEGTAFGKYDQATKRKLVTMIPLKEGITLLDNMELSAKDVEKLNMIGNCKGTSVSKTSYSVPCFDKNPKCKSRSTKNLCNKAAYRKFLQAQCPYSCGWCAMIYEKKHTI